MPSYSIKCCAEGCTATNVRNHRFPNPTTRLDMYNKWLEILNNDDLRNRNPYYVYNCKRLCCAHFDPKYLSQKGTLYRHAVPFKKISDVRNHRFPKPTTRLDLYNRWIEILDNDDLRRGNPHYIYKCKRLCCVHFDPKYISIMGHLYRHAVPLKKISGLKRGSSSIATDERQEVPLKQANVENECSSTSTQNVLVETNNQQQIVLQSQSNTTPKKQNTYNDEIKISETLRRLERLRKTRQSNLIGKNHPIIFKMSQEVGILLQKAVALDSKGCFSEALIYYQKGIELLYDSLKNESNETKKAYFKSKLNLYLTRAEKIKGLLKEQETYHEQIIIENNSSGHSYEKIFKKYLDSEVETVKIEDPYIRLFHQCQNLLMFCELLVKSCSNLKKIFLITTQSLNQSEALEQQKWMNELKESLLSYKVHLDITYSSTLHDRQISFSNGWIVKIGRGLDYFKKPLGKFHLGSCDFDLRSCFETTIDIFHQKTLKQSFG